MEMKIDTIETKRLFLRGFEKKDALFAISIWNDREMGKYLPDPSLDEIDEAYLKSVESLGEDEECCYLISQLQDSGERVGTCSFISSEEGKSYDIAYCVHKNFWRRGYGSEMVQGMIDYVRAQGGEKITVRVNKENVASNRIVSKFGFHPVGEKTYQKAQTELVYTDYLYELVL